MGKRQGTKGGEIRWNVSLSWAWRGPLGTAPTERAGGATVGVSGGGGQGTEDLTS